VHLSSSGGEEKVEAKSSFEEQKEQVVQVPQQLLLGWNINSFLMWRMKRFIIMKAVTSLEKSEKSRNLCQQRISGFWEYQAGTKLGIQEGRKESKKSTGCWKERLKRS
jgi:hypothetical protein